MTRRTARTKTEAIYIEPSDAKAYRAAGWTVVPMEGHHGVWSMLATRPGVAKAPVERGGS